jgi:hypothetical protein
LSWVTLVVSSAATFVQAEGNKERKMIVEALGLVKGSVDQLQRALSLLEQKKYEEAKLSIVDASAVLTTARFGLERAQVFKDDSEKLSYYNFIETLDRLLESPVDRMHVSLQKQLQEISYFLKTHNFKADY